MEKKDTFAPKVKVTIHKGESFFGPGIAELMTLLGSSGSLKEACREMGLSYTKGRHIISRAEEALGYELIARQHGGSGGGASCLTEQGQKLLAAYYDFENEIKEYAEEAFARRFPDGM